MLISIAGYAGDDHETTNTVTYLLNDLEISLQLGKFEFGTAKPIDNRSVDFPFSQLSMHEDALVKHSQSSARKQRPTSTQSTRSMRAQTAFNVEKPRTESRLYQALVRRPKTAPTKLQRDPRSSRKPESPLHRKSPHCKGLDDEFNLGIPVVHEPDSELSSMASSPRTYRSYTQERGDMGKLSHRTHKGSVLDKYFPFDRHNPNYKSERRNQTSSQRTMSAPPKSHNCHGIEAHTIHAKLNSTTLGPNSTVKSVLGYTPPLPAGEPVHKSAWYHYPNHYATIQKPHVNATVYAQWKKRLTRQRSQTSPVKSRYLQDHTNAIKLVAQQNSAFTPA